MFRAFLGGLSLASIFFVAPWAVFLTSGILATRFRAWEILFFGALVDILYVPPDGFYNIPIPATLTALILLVGLEPLRRKLML